MKRAFTLIELLVVIAIIAILAAILFPVFTQAKIAAKKTASISNQKQVTLGVILYQGNNDDVYPRQDDCVDKGSMNPALYSLPFNPTGAGCTTGPFYNRRNHYAWQTWINPYVKNADMFFSPALGKADPANGSGVKSWSQAGEIFFSYALNTSLTGMLNTYNNTTTAGRVRNSWLGGTADQINDVSKTMLLMEMQNIDVNYVPVFLDSSSGTTDRTAYPIAIRENWAPQFKKRVGTTGCVFSNETDNAKVPFSGSIVLGYVDGHAAAIPVDKFLGDTPAAADMTVSSRPPCAFTSGAWTISAAPVWTKPWPMWGLQ